MPFLPPSPLHAPPTYPPTHPPCPQVRPRESPWLLAHCGSPIAPSRRAQAYFSACRWPHRGVRGGGLHAFLALGLGRVGARGVLHPDACGMVASVAASGSSSSWRSCTCRSTDLLRARGGPPRVPSLSRNSGAQSRLAPRVPAVRPWARLAAGYHEGLSRPGKLSPLRFCASMPRRVSACTSGTTKIG